MSVDTALDQLQPIRDLAKNWDIDIAACLEEYLSDLVGNLTEEERRNLPKHHAESLNFSQAALVLQNSSNVYGRKVEYLYKLVVQVQEELIANSGNKNAAAANAASRKSSVDAQIEEFNAFDPHVEFLLLDDCLPVAENGNKINLQEEREDAPRDHGLSFATAATTTRLSLGATLGATNMERSALSGAGGQSASHHVIRGSLDTGSLRLIDGRCDVGDDGILILPGAGRKSAVKIRRSSFFGNMSPRNDAAFDQQPGRPEQGSTSFAMDGDHYDDHDDDGGGFAFAGDDDDDGFGDQNAPSEHTTIQSGEQSQSTPRRATTAKIVKNDFIERKADPWALLDAHSQGASTKSREHKFGTTCKLPPEVSELPSERLNGTRTKRSRNTPAPKSSQRRPRVVRQSLALECFKAKLFAQRRRNKILSGLAVDGDDVLLDGEADIPQIPLKGLVFGHEFLYIAKETAKLKRAQARAESKELKNARQTVEDEDHNNYGDGDDGFGAMDYGGGDDDDDDGGGFGFGGDDDDEVGNTGMGNLDDMFRDNHTNEGGGIETEGKTFEELCRAHMAAFAKGAEAYAAETRLSKRVGGWHDNLIPILEEEENRPEFDIYNYTMRVVSTCEFEHDDDSCQKKKTVDFGAVAKDCERYDVCRLFLSVLSLSNSGNVKLKHGGFDENLEITLLDANLDRPMEKYLAPSVLEDDE